MAGLRYWHRPRLPPIKRTTIYYCVSVLVLWCVAGAHGQGADVDNRTHAVPNRTKDVFNSSDISDTGRRLSDSSDLLKCFGKSNLMTCMKLSVLQKVEYLLEESHKSGLNKTTDFLNGLVTLGSVDAVDSDKGGGEVLIRKMVEGEWSGKLDGAKEKEMDVLLVEGVYRYFRDKVVTLRFIPGLTVKVFPPRTPKEYVRMSVELSGENLQQAMSRTMGMPSPWMMIGPMITLGMFPFMLANLKYMVMNAFMINNMALMMALRTTVNNLVFGDNENDNIVYRNKGYSNEFPNRPVNYGPGHGAPIVYKVKPWNRPSLAAPNAADQFKTTNKHSVAHHSYETRDSYGSYSDQSSVTSNHRPGNLHRTPPAQEGTKVKYIAHHDYPGSGSDTRHKSTPPVSVYRPSHGAGSRYKDRPPIPASHVTGGKYQPNAEYLGSQSTNKFKYHSPVRPIQDTTTLYKQPDSNFFSQINHQIDAVNLGVFGYNQKTRFTDDNSFQTDAQSYIKDSYEPQEKAGGEADWIPNNRKQDNADWTVTDQDQVPSGHSKLPGDALKTGTEVGTVFPVYTAGENSGAEKTSVDSVYPVRGESRYSERHTPQIPVHQGTIGSEPHAGVIPPYSVGVGIDASEKHKPQISVYQGTIGSGQYAGSGRIPPYSVGVESDSAGEHTPQDPFHPVEFKTKYVGNHGQGTVQNFQVNPIVVPEDKPTSKHQSQQPNLNVPVHAADMETKMSAGTAQNFQVSSGIRFGDPFDINDATTKLGPHRDSNPTQHHYVNGEVMNVSPHDDEPAVSQYHAVDLNDENEFVNFPQQFVKTPTGQSADSNTVKRRLGMIADSHQLSSAAKNRNTPGDDEEQTRVMISMTNDDRTADKYPEPLATFRDDYHS